MTADVHRTIRRLIDAGDLAVARRKLHAARRAGVGGLYLLEVALVAREVPGLDVMHAPRSREDASGRARAAETAPRPSDRRPR